MITLALLAFSMFTAWTRRKPRGAGLPLSRPTPFGARNALGCLTLGVLLWRARGRYSDNCGQRTVSVEQAPALPHGENA